MMRMVSVTLRDSETTEFRLQHFQELQPHPVLARCYSSYIYVIPPPSCGHHHFLCLPLSSLLNVRPPSSTALGRGFRFDDAVGRRWGACIYPVRSGPGADEMRRRMRSVLSSPLPELCEGQSKNSSQHGNTLDVDKPGLN